MMQRVLKILTWILIAAWFVVILGFVEGEADKVLCNRIEVILSDTVQNRFVTRSDIKAILEKGEINLQGYSLYEIDLRELEKNLEQNPYIGNAEVSTDISGRLEVRVEQKVPLVRIMPRGKQGFYLDMDGRMLPLSEQFTPLITLASGRIEYPDSNAEIGKQLREIYHFSKYLSGHPFWNEQIVQIYVNQKGEYELIPRVGAHQILMGSMDMWEKKLKNLELLYKQGLSRYGWNTYGIINLKYTNQVICTKR